MRIFEFYNASRDGFKFIRFDFLWIFSFSIGYHEHNGSHLILGIGLTPFEISTQLTIWSIGE
jgi:hypothetical protein